MRKINIVFNESNHSGHNQWHELMKHANAHLNLQQLWEAVAPKILSQSSFAGQLDKGHLIIYAHNASIATKIKLTSASLLTQLHNLQKTDSIYRDYKVTAITVKVQVISPAKPISRTPRKLSNKAAEHLKQLAEKIGESALATKLKQLAQKT
ncbi:MAG: DciA family protein [Methylophilaceae bacterium]